MPKAPNKYYYAVVRSAQQAKNLISEIEDMILEEAPEWDEEEVTFLIEESMRELGRLKSSASKYFESIEGT